MRYLFVLATLLVIACGGSGDDAESLTTPTSANSAASATAPNAPPAPAGTPQTGVEITSVYAMGAPAGGTAFVEVQVTPGAVCTLVYVDPDGDTSDAAGLGQATADANGDVRWEWQIADDAVYASRGELTVTCGDAVENIGLTIG